MCFPIREPLCGFGALSLYFLDRQTDLRASLLASGFLQRRLFCYFTDGEESRNAWYHITDFCDPPASRVTSHMALQHRLGILSERSFRNDSADPRCSAAFWQAIAPQFQPQA